MRATLRAFAAFKLTSPEYFSSHCRFLTAQGKLTADNIADGWLEVMGKADFRTLHTWVKDHYLWSRIVLIKAALLFFEGRSKETGTLFFELLKFLHDELGRLPQFEIYVAHRLFLLSSREPFFSPVQQNTADLDRKIHSMAWGLAHWRSLFEMLAIEASFVGATPFPIPHFLSFDRQFVKLTETLQLSGLIYAANGRRCEHIYSEALWRPVSDLLGGERRQLCTEEAIRDRQRRNQNDGALDKQLVQSEATLTGLRTSSFPRTRQASRTRRRSAQPSPTTRWSSSCTKRERLHRVRLPAAALGQERVHCRKHRQPVPHGRVPRSRHARAGTRE